MFQARLRVLVVALAGMTVATTAMAAPRRAPAGKAAGKADNRTGNKVPSVRREPTTAQPIDEPSSAPRPVTTGPQRRVGPEPAAAVAAGPVTAAVPPRSSLHALLPLADVRPGMEGEAWTVFQGNKPEPFKVRVISIMRKFLPKQDVILVRAEDPRLAFSGIVAGMSGSPVYVGGRLMGAIAYGWSFAKEPLGGVTPIEYMLAERNRPRRLGPELARETGTDGLTRLTLAEGGGGQQPASPAAPSVSAASVFGEPHLVPVAIPFSASGFHPRALADFSRALNLEGFVPVQAGGGRELEGGKTAPAPLRPGSAIGVELVRGDMSMVGTGTVTYVDGDTVLAFGHPMFGAGEVYLPMVDAEIHAILPSLSQSMKLSSAVREIGALVQDRQSCIVGDLGARATMVPVTVQIRASGAPTRRFRTEIARNRRLTPALAALVVGNALLDSEPDATDMVVKVASHISLKGRPPLELTDELFAPEGISRQSLNSTRGLRALSELLSNPFEPVILDRFDVDISIEYRRDTAEIVGLALPGDEVRPGQKVGLRVTLRPYQGAEFIETIPIVLPRDVAGDTVRIEVASGALAKPEMPPIESLAIYLDNLGRYFPPTSIVVSVQTPDEGAAVHGRLLRDLPGAAADTLRPGNQSRRADSFRVADRTVHSMKKLITGRQELSVYVRDDVLGAMKP